MVVDDEFDDESANRYTLEIYMFPPTTLYHHMTHKVMTSKGVVSYVFLVMRDMWQTVPCRNASGRVLILIIIVACRHDLPEVAYSYIKALSLCITCSI